LSGMGTIRKLDRVAGKACRAQWKGKIVKLFEKKGLTILYHGPGRRLPGFSRRVGKKKPKKTKKRTTLERKKKKGSPPQGGDRKGGDARKRRRKEKIGDRTKGTPAAKKGGEKR